MTKYFSILFVVP